MNINAYIWNIFDLGKANDVDIGVAKDLFLANLTQRKAVYPGADELDYAALVAAGIIDTPDYWLANHGAFHNLGALLCALGGAVK